MKLKMQAMDGPVIIESSDVTQFLPLTMKVAGNSPLLSTLLTGEESPRG